MCICTSTVWFITVVEAIWAEILTNSIELHNAATCFGCESQGEHVFMIACILCILGYIMIITLVFITCKACILKLMGRWFAKPEAASRHLVLMLSIFCHLVRLPIFCMIKTSLYFWREALKIWQGAKQGNKWWHCRRIGSRWWQNKAVTL